MRCSVQNCYNDTKKTTKSHGITFHLFPKEATLRLAWVEALALTDWEPKERSTICSEHFRNEDFYQTKTGLRKIKSGAVPVVVQDSAEDLDAPATLRVCRICLAMDIRMYDIRAHKLDQIYEQITGVYLSTEDRLPLRICWECAHRLHSAARFKGKALRSHTLLMDTLHSRTYITIRDLKAINRSHSNLKSTLIQKIYDSNDYDLHICDNQIVKSETKSHCSEYNGNDNSSTFDNVIAYSSYDDNGKENDNENLAIIEVPAEVKDESTNEIFFNEYVDFESDDDKKLSEIYSEVTPKLSEIYEVTAKSKSKSVKKVKKKKLKVEKKMKTVKRKDDDDNPSSTMDKYKTSEIKRRKTNDGLDESLFIISTLTYEEQIAEIEKRQESTSYKNAVYKCTICYRGFQIRDRYDAHIVRHSEQCGAYECFICKTRLKTSRALRKHLTAQHTEKFSCKGCPFVTRNRGVAREHEKWHAGTKYQCPHCPSEFDKLTTYMGHIRIKHVSDFVCELCGYTFVSQKGIEVHKKKKHRLDDKNVELEGPYCDMCDVKFVSEEAHSRHLKLSSRHSSDNDPNRIRNDSQSMRAENSGRVMRRIERRPVIHPRGSTEPEIPASGPVTCEQCGVQLRDLRLYAQHFRRAHPDKNRTKYPAMKTPCMCELCGRIFQSMALLKDHMWVHTGEKRFKCSRCPKSFTQKTNLVFHERVHSATRPTYECPLCGKHFAFFNNRRRHMFIHTGLKPFKCDTCGKAFTTAGEHRAHVEHVHLKKPWPKRARRHDHWHADRPPALEQ